MNEITTLAGWNNFYVIMGSSAGALIGLQFVVMALIAAVPTSASEQKQQQSGDAFATPTIVHLGTVLLLSALMTAPWHKPGIPTLILGFLGLVGVLYSLIVTSRVSRQTLYKPVLEDWIFHCVSPLIGYALLALSAYGARVHVFGSLFGVAGAALLLLFTGIHNAWDAAAYHTFVTRQRLSEKQK